MLRDAEVPIPGLVVSIALYGEKNEPVMKEVSVKMVWGFVRYNPGSAE